MYDFWFFLLCNPFTKAHDMCTNLHFPTPEQSDSNHFKVRVIDKILFRLYVPIFVIRYVTYITNICIDLTIIWKPIKGIS